MTDPLTDHDADIPNNKPNSKRSRTDYHYHLRHSYRDRRLRSIPYRDIPFRVVVRGAVDGCGGRDRGRCRTRCRYSGGPAGDILHPKEEKCEGSIRAGAEGHGGGSEIPSGQRWAYPRDEHTTHLRGDADLGNGTPA